MTFRSVTDRKLMTGFMEKIAHISVSPASLEFSRWVDVGKNLKTRLAISNNGTTELSVVAGGFEGTDFSISGRASITVKPKRTAKLSIVFGPTSPGPQVTLLKIFSNDPDRPSIDVPLSGTGR